MRGCRDSIRTSLPRLTRSWRCRTVGSSSQLRWARLSCVVGGHGLRQPPAGHDVHAAPRSRSMGCRTGMRVKAVMSEELCPQGALFLGWRPTNAVEEQLRVTSLTGARLRFESHGGSFAGRSLNLVVGKGVRECRTSQQSALPSQAHSLGIKRQCRLYVHAAQPGGAQ
jgi:hypothetical protein